MKIDVKAHRVRRGLVFVLNLTAVLTWFGGVLVAAQMPEGIDPYAIGSAIMAGLLLAAFAAILETLGQTRYLTALIAQRMLDGVNLEADPSAQTPPRPTRRVFGRYT